MLHDINGRWTKEGVFAHDVEHVDPELQARSANLFKECEGVVGQWEALSLFLNSLDTAA